MSQPPPKPSVGELALAFARISLLGFGGALPWAHRALVERRRWLTTREFADMLALCQFLPGPTIVNVAVVLGQRLRGWPGALAAVCALILPPAVLVTVVGTAYQHYATNPQVRHALTGVTAAAAGLLAATAVRLVILLVKAGRPVPVLIAAVGFLALVALRWPLPLALVVLGPLSVALAWRRPA